MEGRFAENAVSFQGTVFDSPEIFQVAEHAKMETEEDGGEI
jgi:hypothetical protein